RAAAGKVDGWYAVCPQRYHRVDGGEPVQARDGYRLLPGGRLRTEYDRGGGNVHRAERLSYAQHESSPTQWPVLRRLPDALRRYSSLHVGARRVVDLAISKIVSQRKSLLRFRGGGFSQYSHRQARLGQKGLSAC